MVLQIRFIREKRDEIEGRVAHLSLRERRGRDCLLQAAADFRRKFVRRAIGRCACHGRDRRFRGLHHYIVTELEIVVVQDTRLFRRSESRAPCPSAARACSHGRAALAASRQWHPAPKNKRVFGRSSALRSPRMAEELRAGTKQFEQSIVGAGSQHDNCSAGTAHHGGHVKPGTALEIVQPHDRGVIGR